MQHFCPFEEISIFQQLLPSWIDVRPVE